MVPDYLIAEDSASIKIVESLMRSLISAVNSYYRLICGPISTNWLYYHYSWRRCSFLISIFVFSMNVLLLLLLIRQNLLGILTRQSGRVHVW